MDIFSKKKRSEIMALIKGRDTKPERLVRSIIHRLGYRFRLHRQDLPGTPDIALPKYQKVVFIHGCFWHSHARCPRAARPTTNVAFWQKKLDANAARDRHNIRQLKKKGWHVLIVWQCQTKNAERLIKRIAKFLND